VTEYIPFSKWFWQNGKIIRQKKKKKKEKEKRDWTLVVEDNTKLKGLKNIVISTLFPFTPDPPGSAHLFFAALKIHKFCASSAAPVALCSCAH
jgi:hypothetical protein